MTAGFEDLHCRAFEERRTSSDNQASGGEEPSEKKARLTQAELLIALAKDRAELLFRHQDRAYVDIRIGDHRETWPIKSSRCRQWLKRLYYAEHNKVPNAEAVQEALDHLEAVALFEGEERQVELRVAGHAARIYIDLGTTDWKAIEIDEDGWRVIDDPPVRFRRPAGMRPLPAPTRGGDISTLRSFVNVRDEGDFVLVVCWLLAAMRDRGPYPVLAISGEQGTAKSTLVAILRALIDPNASPLRALPREDRELFIQSNNGWLLAFDNVSRLPAWTSDSLCRLSTGGGFAVRQLHTDQDEILFDACRPIVLNGIGDMVGRADLADRSIFITLEPITEANRRAEDELWIHIRRELPGVLGVLCNAVSYGLRHRDLVKLDRLPRMADFAKWGSACEGAFWSPGTFASAYDDNQHGANDAVKADVDLEAATATLRKMKNDRDRLVYLPPVVVEDLRQLPGGLDGPGRLFSFHVSGRLRDLLKMTLAEAGVVLPHRVAFHVFCHTWATWMRQHGGLDTYDLVRTDRWADPESADRYAHVVVSEQARRADLLPGAKKKTG